MTKSYLSPFSPYNDVTCHSNLILRLHPFFPAFRDFSLSQNRWLRVFDFVSVAKAQMSNEPSMAAFLDRLKTTVEWHDHLHFEMGCVVRAPLLMPFHSDFASISVS